MSISNPSTIVDFDVETAREAIEQVIEGTVRSLVEYDKESFNPLYVDDLTLSFYDDEEHMMDHFERIHSYVHIDFTEIDLFTDELFPVADRVEYITTAMDAFTLLRIYINHDGLFVALDPDEPVDPVVDAIKDVIESNR